MTGNQSATDQASVEEESEPTFDVLPLSAEVRRAVDDLGYVNPSPVQRAVFGPATTGVDLVVQARTGTGKTAAFGLPLVDRLIDRAVKRPQALVLSPTRELALQINRELDSLARHNGVTSTAVYGGAPMGAQVDAIRGGAQIIAGTPGRVLDHLERGTLDPSSLKILILDESDEMLSMGFLPQITKVMEVLPKGHQTLLFSATLPPDVSRIAETRLTDPTFITLSGDHIGALSIDHVAYRSRGQKSEELVQIIETENPESAIVFCNTRDQTKRIAEALKKKGYSADWLNADLAQSDRERVMKNTREGNLRFLVATDVAARGIDISHLTHVINADFPESTENYVHRTGRTGRAGRTGTAISLIAPRDIGNLYMLRLTYKIFPVERELPSARDLQTRKEADLVEFLAEGFSAHAPRADDLSLARRLLASPEAELVVAGLLRDHLGARPHTDDDAATRRREKAPEPVPASPSSSRSDARAEHVTGSQNATGAQRGGPSTQAEADKPKRKLRERKREDRPARPAFPTEESTTVTSATTGEVASASARDERSARAQTEERPQRRERTSRGERPVAPRESRPVAVREDGLEEVSAASLLGGSVLDLAEERSARPPSSERPRRDTGAAVAHQPVDNGQSSRPVKEAPRDLSPSNGERSNSGERSANGASSDDLSDGDEFGRIFVTAGRSDGGHPKDVRGLLLDAGIHPDDIGEIAVRERHTFVSVVSDLLDEAIGILDGAEIGSRTARAERARPRTG